MKEADAIYARRFGDAEIAARDRVWREVARYLQRYIPHDSTVLDIAADRGHFIGHIAAAERWATDVRDTSAHLAPGVRFVRADGLALAQLLPASHFDRIFMSNYLEHLPSSEAVIEQFRVVAALLRPGGRVIVLQPNIRLTGAAYWDFIDHKVPLTERSLVEAAEAAGLTVHRLVTRFLPYTTKSRLPRVGWLVRGYLAFPPAWRLFGKQSLLIAERPGD
jgi:SAM-dependent methyltransferase